MTVGSQGSQGSQSSQSRPLWSIATTAVYLACSERLVERLIDSSELPARRIGRSRLIRIDPADVERLLKPISGPDAEDIGSFITETTA